MKPPIGDTVIVDVADVPTVTAVGDVAEIAKPPVKLNVAVVECDSVPLVPVIVTLKVEIELHDSVAVPEPVTVFGVIAPQVGPAGTASVRLTIPVNPFRAVTVIVEVTELPGLPETDAADIVKSITVKVAVVEWESVPLVPVIVNV